MSFRLAPDRAVLSPRARVSPPVHLPLVDSEDPSLVTGVACASSPTHVESHGWRPVFPPDDNGSWRRRYKLIRAGVEMSGVRAGHGKQTARPRDEGTASEWALSGHAGLPKAGTDRKSEPTLRGGMAFNV